MLFTRILLQSRSREYKRIFEGMTLLRHWVQHRSAKNNVPITLCITRFLPNVERLEQTAV